MTNNVRSKEGAVRNSFNDRCKSCGNLKCMSGGETGCFLKQLSDWFCLCQMARDMLAQSHNNNNNNQAVHTDREVTANRPDIIII